MLTIGGLPNTRCYIFELTKYYYFLMKNICYLHVYCHYLYQGMRESLHGWEAGVQNHPLLTRASIVARQACCGRIGECLWGSQTTLEIASFLVLCCFEEVIGLSKKEKMCYIR